MNMDRVGYDKWVDASVNGPASFEEGMGGQVSTFNKEVSTYLSIGE